MRHGSLGTRLVATDLDQDHRLDAGGGAQGTHESARLAYPLDIQQDVLCLRVGYQIVQGFAEIHIGGRTHRYYTGKTHIVGLRPVQYGGTQGA